MKLEKMIERARTREEHDDHLTTEERIALVEEYKRQHPNETLSANIDDAFVSILFD